MFGCHHSFSRLFGEKKAVEARDLWQFIYLFIVCVSNSVSKVTITSTISSTSASPLCSWNRGWFDSIFLLQLSMTLKFARCRFPTDFQNGFLNLSLQFHGGFKFGCGYCIYLVSSFINAVSRRR